jgi:hypothetical protein
MADKGIIFSAPMVRALLAGRKTQTRRLMPHQEALRTIYAPMVCGTAIRNYAGEDLISRAPHVIGDRLWVREAWTVASVASDCAEVRYRASEGDGYTAMTEQVPIGRIDKLPKRRWPVWNPALHMFRWASRITLTVTDVRVQRLQEITEADARAEGIERVGSYFIVQQSGFEPSISALRCYGKLWNSLHTASGETWDANPWVVGVTFDVEQRNIDAVAA